MSAGDSTEKSRLWSLARIARVLFKSKTTKTNRTHIFDDALGGGILCVSSFALLHIYCLLCDVIRVFRLTSIMSVCFSHRNVRCKLDIYKRCRALIDRKRGQRLWCELVLGGTWISAKIKRWKHQIHQNTPTVYDRSTRRRRLCNGYMRWLAATYIQCNQIDHVIPPKCWCSAEDCRRAKVTAMKDAICRPESIHREVTRNHRACKNDLFTFHFESRFCRLLLFWSRTHAHTIRFITSRKLP